MFSDWKGLFGLGALIAIGLTALALVGDASEPDISTFNKSGDTRAFVEHIDSLLDRMPQDAAYLPVSQNEIAAWQVEILPYFAYEELVNFPIVPDSIELTPFLDGQMHNHILGQAYCHNVPGFDSPKKIEMNLRTGNPNSSWFMESERFLPTLIHEMIHIQGVCGSGEHSETATQVVTLETMAAMVNHGNLKVLYPLLAELRDIALSAERFRAMEAEDVESYESWRSGVVEDAFENARSDKSQRYWNQDISHKVKLEYILRAYNFKVWEQVQTAFRSKKHLTGDLYLPYFAESERAVRFDLANKPRPFALDDLVYFINHAEELVQEYLERR